MHKATGTPWVKRARKKGVEDTQMSGCVPDEVAQQNKHAKSSFFNACCTGMNQNTFYVSSGFSMQKEARAVLRWNINLSDEECPLVEKKHCQKQTLHED